MRSALLIADLRSRWRSLAALAGGCFVFVVVLAGTYSAIGGAQGFTKSFGEKPPRLFSAFSGTSGGDLFTPSHYLAFGYVHPLFLVLSLSVAVSMGVAAVATDVETGRAELLFTLPVRRTAILDTRVLGWALAQLVVLTVAVLGGFVGRALSSDMHGVSPWVPLRVACQFIPLATFVAAVAFAASCRCRTRGAALGVAVGVTAGSYVVNLVALLWSPLSALRHANPFGYYTPTAAADGIAWGDAALLLGSAGLLFALGRYWLGKRDLA